MASLSGRADATLVKAATDAAMANVPVDVSRINERVSRSYTAMTQSVGKSWGNALKSIGEIGGALMQNAKEKKDDIGKPFENTNVDAKKEFKGIGDAAVGKIKSNLETKGLELVDKDAKKDNFFSSSTDGIFSKGLGETTADSMQASIDLLPKAPKGFQALPTFDHVDKDGNSSTITVSNTDEFSEKLRDQIYELRGKKEKDLKAVESNSSYSIDEKSSKKKQIKADHKKEKKRLKDVKDSMHNSNRRFAEFNEVLKSQLEGDNINMEASGMYGVNKMNFANALLNKGTALADGSKAVQGYNENGNMVFTYVDKNNRPIKSGGKNLTLAEGDVGSLLVQQSPLRPLMDGMIDRKSIEQRYKFGFDGISNEIARTVENKVKDKNTFLDLAFYQSENTDSSLADTLHSVKYDSNKVPIIGETGLAREFVSAIATLGNSTDYDMDGDGDFDKDDYNTEENYMKLTRKALSGDDLGLSKILLKQHYQLQAEVHFNNAVDVNNPNTVINNTSLTAPNEEIVREAASSVEPENVFQGSRNPNGIFVNKADQIRVYNSISNKKQEINGADGSFYVLSGDGNSYMKFTGSKENTPSAGRKLYYYLNSKKGALVGTNKGARVSFEKMLENNAAYSTRLPSIQTQKEIDKENEGLTTPTAKEIQDSIDRGEQSAFNRDPKTGELLPEGSTLNNLGEVVEVEGNNKYYNMISK